MTQQDKELLLKDLCARLPYHPILNWKFIDNTSKDEELKELSDLYIWWITKAQDCEVKPYLRPMSSMTKEEFDEYEIANEIDTAESSKAIHKNLNREKHISSWYHGVDWLNAHHFDYRGLIAKGLALEAKEGIYNQN